MTEGRREGRTEGRKRQRVLERKVEENRVTRAGVEPALPKEKHRILVGGS